MPKDLQDIPAQLKQPKVFVARVGNDIYFKAKIGAYNTQRVQYGRTLPNGDTSGVQLVYDGGPVLPTRPGDVMIPPDHYGAFTVVWWVDAAMWPHLTHPLAHEYTSLDAIPLNAQGFNTLYPLHLWPPPAAVPAGNRYRIGLAGTILTIESKTIGGGGPVRTFADRMAALFGDFIEATLDDPRHIGTHHKEFTNLLPNHLHLVRASSGSWRSDIRTLATEATRARLVPATETDNLVGALLGNPVPAAAVTAPAAVSAPGPAPGLAPGSAPPGPQPAAQPQPSAQLQSPVAGQPPGG